MKSRTWRDPVVEVYKRGIDLTLLLENLKLTPAERLEKFVRFHSFVLALRRAGRARGARRR
jgi:hypothetical protein